MLCDNVHAVSDIYQRIISRLPRLGQHMQIYHLKIGCTLFDWVEDWCNG